MSEMSKTLERHARIERILRRLKILWAQDADMKFSRLLSNIGGPIDDDGFFFEDDDWERALDELIREARQGTLSKEVKECVK